MTRFYGHLTQGRCHGRVAARGAAGAAAELRAGRVKVASPAGDVVLPPHPAVWAGFRVHGVP